ncbi:unnamed protein product [Rotaria sp. Silwood1]|nr:unnamed protein product [Rotaria sp. Silwood1]
MSTTSTAISTVLPFDGSTNKIPAISTEINTIFLFDDSTDKISATSTAINTTTSFGDFTNEISTTSTVISIITSLDDFTNEISTTSTAISTASSFDGSTNKTPTISTEISSVFSFDYSTDKISTTSTAISTVLPFDGSTNKIPIISTEINTIFLFDDSTDKISTASTVINTITSFGDFTNEISTTSTGISTASSFDGSTTKIPAMSTESNSVFSFDDSTDKISTTSTVINTTSSFGDFTNEISTTRTGITSTSLKPLSSKPNLIGLIVGIVMAGISVPVLLGVTGYLIVRRHKQKRRDKEFQGDFDLPIDQKYLKKNQHDNGAKVYSCELSEQNPLHSTIFHSVKKWVGSLENGFKIKKIEIIQNRKKFNHFREQIEFVERHMKEQIFQPNWDCEKDMAERKIVLKRLERLYKQVDHNRIANIVRVWHGCDKKVLPKLLADGFASLEVLDDGWFGKGMYFSSSAQYASRYCQGENPCLLMCYVLVLNPFPVISCDARHDKKPEDFRFYGRGNHNNYQCHYIPVSPVTDKEFTTDYRPPKRIDDARYDELVVFESANILPQIVVHLERTLSPSRETKNELKPTAIPRTNTRTIRETKNWDQNHRAANRRRYEGVLITQKE